MIGKVKDRNRLEFFLRNILVWFGIDGWNCVVWVKEVFEIVLCDKKVMGNFKYFDWDVVWDIVMWYVE